MAFQTETSSRKLLGGAVSLVALLLLAVLSASFLDGAPRSWALGLLVLVQLFVASFGLMGFANENRWLRRLLIACGLVSLLLVVVTAADLGSRPVEGAFSATGEAP